MRTMILSLALAAVFVFSGTVLFAETLQTEDAVAVSQTKMALQTSGSISSLPVLAPSILDGIKTQLQICDPAVIECMNSCVHIPTLPDNCERECINRHCG